MTISFDKNDKVKSSVSIFNGGQAGVAKEVKVSVLKKGVDYTGEKDPAYKIRYTDDSGHVDVGYFYLDKEAHNPQYGTFEDSIKKQWQKLDSILTACGSNGGGEFKNPKEVLDTLMLKIKSEVKGKTFNVFANYGHANNPRKWLQIRSWVPFIEASNVEPTTLKKTKIDQMERLVPDTDESSSNKNFPDNVDDSWAD